MPELHNQSLNTPTGGPSSSPKVKPRLGRGLGSLLGDAVEASESIMPTPPSAPASIAPAMKAPSAQVTTSAPATDPQAPAVAAPVIPETQRIWNVAIERLKANEQQPRQVFEDAALQELAASIRQQGILQPIVARRLSEREFEIIAGERRWRAAQLAGLREVPVILKQVEGQSSLELAILENIQRADLNPIEEAEAYDLLMSRYGLTQQDVAERLGKERSSVANVLRLLTLPPEVKLMVGGGQLSAGHAKVLLAVEGMAEQINLAKEVVRERLSVRALEKMVQAQKQSKSQKPVVELGGSAPVAKQLAEGLASSLQKMMGTKVSLDYLEGRGRISIHFHSDDQLTELIERMRKGWTKS
ncbi:MAG TPA: ParB/RepB/Spo0J family partition protein [Pseudobdellovibrionaceae bacterium]|nr:ParB/RepB/Spo0J family partition protein [Pseudobdellovibrionaceae bacterium]